MASQSPKDNGSIPKKARPAPSAAIMMLALEILAVGVFALLAGASPEAGHIMILIMITLWVLYAITNAGVISRVGNAFTSLTTNPTNK